MSHSAASNRNWPLLADDSEVGDGALTGKGEPRMAALQTPSWHSGAARDGPLQAAAAVLTVQALGEVTGLRPSDDLFEVGRQAAATQGVL